MPWKARVPCLVTCLTNALSPTIDCILPALSLRSGAVKRGSFRGLGGEQRSTTHSINSNGKRGRELLFAKVFD